ncbi:MAG TPA: HD domain-containing phosphohydrolase [Gaiellales bacterium]|nr:HD domain-containing phosphohydrolase [Gaiellales bacterium]
MHPAGASSENLDDALAAALARHLTPAELCDITCALLHRRLAVPVAVWVPRDGGLALCEQRGHDWIVERRARVDVPGALVEPLGDAAAPAVLVASPGVAEAHAASLQSAAALLSDALGGEPPDTGQPAGTRWLWQAFARLAEAREHGAVLSVVARALGSALGLACVQVGEIVEGELVLAQTWLRDERSREHALDGAALAALADAGDYERTVELEGCRLGLPLRTSTGTHGYLVGYGGRGALAADLVDDSALLVAHAAVALESLRAFERKEAEAATDALTGLANHRSFHETMRGLVAARSAGFALVLADIDDFKELNDTRGHVAGDDALSEVGVLLRRGMRPADSVFRIGGEEFALLLPETTKANARTVCRRLQRSLAAIDLEGWRLTLSFGVASWPGDGSDLRDLLQAADAALYEAKRLGKDRITFADERLIARRSPSMAARTRRSFEQMRHLQTLSRTLSAAQRPADVARSLLRVLRETLPHDRAAVWARAGDDVGEAPIASSGTRKRRSLAELRPFALEAMQGGQAQLVDTEGATFLAAPLVGEHATVGALVLAGDSEGRFDRDDVRMLEVMAHVAGLAFQNAILHEQAAEERARTQVLLDLARELAHSATPDTIGEALTRAVVERVACDRCSLWLYENGDSVRCGSAGSADGEAVVERYERDRSLASELRLASGKTVVSSANERGLPPGSQYPAAALTAEVPVQLHGALVGTLSLLRLAGAPFAAPELALLEGMALQAALALDGQRIASELEASFLATIDALVRALEAQDMYTSGHALSIADLARRVGRVLGLDATALRDVEHAAVLHDIGKIGIPSELLRKRGPLSSGEREHMRAHPEIGARILEPVERLRQLAPLVRFSHECWDGSGYPDGLAREQIPLGARIIAVCDAFDAMGSDRPYRGGRSTADALVELRKHSGTQFDPAVVEAFEQAVRDHRAPTRAGVSA